MSQETCLANARIVLSDRVAHGRLTFDGDTIVSVEETPDVPTGAIDCDSDYIVPGLVELHTDNLERHIQPRPGVDWPLAPAILAHDGELAATGITTVFDALRVGSITEGKGRYDKYARSTASEILRLRDAGLTKISHFLHLRAEVCSETLLDELGEFGAEDRVGILSIMDHTPGQRQFRDLAKLKDYVCGKHGMNEAEFADHVTGLTAIHARLGEAHEAGAVAAAQRLGAVLASHDDTVREHVVVSAGHGVRLAEFPTTVEAAQACHDHGIAVMMGAPNLIRGGSHSGNVAAAELAEKGLLDILSSDYVPSALITSAFLLADLWDDLPRAVATVTATPARATGLEDRGVIAEGLLADMVRVAHIDGVPVIRGVWSHGRQVG